MTTAMHRPSGILCPTDWPKVQILAEPGSVFTKVRVFDDEKEVKEETSLRSSGDGKSEQDITLLKSLTSW